MFLFRKTTVTEQAERKKNETVHLIVLIFSLLLDGEFLQSGIHVQLVRLQLPEERLSLYPQTHAHNLEISAGRNNYVLIGMVKKQPGAAERGC